MGDEVGFLYADKHQYFLQDDTTFFGGRGHACSDNQSDGRILWNAISQEGLDKLLNFLDVQRPS